MKTELDPLLYGTGSSITNSAGLLSGNDHLSYYSSTNDHSNHIFQWCYWIVVFLQLFSIVVLFLGQTLAIFFYDLTVRLGFQEDVEDIGASLVQVNRSFGIADTVLYLPILISSLLGLVWKWRKPSLVCTAASAGIHSYWSLTTLFIFLLEGRNIDLVTDWNYYVPITTYIECAVYFVYGIGVLTFLYVHMDRILSEFQ
ncbi:hypothetical protein IV203_028004 [Nitzschia inconspicua]|uniref:Uncharacterized protein n=1 Tax=Nitzschia inconspicua TaxID=303405 RepID=A0A9K3Q3Y2_9STRA|nr:hypothetical protein IV203_028004 [Nitzschia inconspicua]